MELQIINDLFESRMFNSRNAMSRYTAEDVANMTFLNFLAIQVLKSDFDTADFATDYLYQTFRSGDFSTLRNNATDLFWMLHVLESKDISMLKEHPGNEIEFKKINIDDMNVKIWVRSAIKGRTTESTDRRFLISLEKMLNIRIGDYRNVRLLASEWITLTDEQRQLVMTRLLFAFRKRMPRSELLPHLEQLAKHKKLEIVDAHNPEEENKETTKSDLIKKLVVGAAFGAAVALPAMAAHNRYKEFKSKIDAIPVHRHGIKENAAASISAGSIASVVQPMMITSRVKRGDRKKKGNK